MLYKGARQGSGRDISCLWISDLSENVLSCCFLLPGSSEADVGKADATIDEEN